MITGGKWHRQNIGGNVIHITTAAPSIARHAGVMIAALPREVKGFEPVPIEDMEDNGRLIEWAPELRRILQALLMEMSGNSDFESRTLKEAEAILVAAGGNLWFFSEEDAERFFRAADCRKRYAGDPMMVRVMFDKETLAISEFCGVADLLLTSGVSAHDVDEIAMALRDSGRARVTLPDTNVVRLRMVLDDGLSDFEFPTSAYMKDMTATSLCQDYRAWLAGKIKEADPL